MEDAPLYYRCAEITYSLFTQTFCSTLACGHVIYIYIYTYIYGRAGARTATYIMWCAAWETFGDQAGHNAQPLDSDVNIFARVAKPLPCTPSAETALQPFAQQYFGGVFFHVRAHTHTHRYVASCCAVCLLRCTTVPHVDVLVLRQVTLDCLVQCCLNQGEPLV